MRIVQQLMTTDVRSLVWMSHRPCTDGGRTWKLFDVVRMCLSFDVVFSTFSPSFVYSSLLCLASWWRTVAPAWDLGGVGSPPTSLHKLQLPTLRRMTFGAGGIFVGRWENSRVECLLWRSRMLQIWPFTATFISFMVAVESDSFVMYNA